MTTPYDCIIPGPYPGITTRIQARVRAWQGFLQITFTSPDEIGQAIWNGHTKLWLKCERQWPSWMRTAIMHTLNLRPDTDEVL